MGIGLPVVAMVIPAGWFVLTRWAFSLRGGKASDAARALVRKELDRLGHMTTPEVRVALLFGTVAILWMGSTLPGFLLAWIPGIPGGDWNWGWNPLLAWAGERLGLPVRIQLGNTQIAVMGALAAFLIPSGGSAEVRGGALMAWEDTARLPWNVVLLFGGGLSLAASLTSTGLADWLGAQMHFLTGLPAPLLILVIVAVVVFLTELTSNVATVTGFLPVLGVIAIEAGLPAEQLILPVAIAGSAAFMLPVATAPNAIVYASGAATQSQMIRAGFRLNLLAILAIATVGSVAAMLGFGG